MKMPPSGKAIPPPRIADLPPILKTADVLRSTSGNHLDQDDEPLPPPPMSPPGAQTPNSTTSPNGTSSSLNPNDESNYAVTEL